MIQNLKAGLSKIRNSYGTGVLAYHCEAMKYLCSIKNYVARVSLGNRLPFEAFGGDKPDISMIRYKFWEPVYYCNWTDKSDQVLIHPGRFVGFSWNVDDPMILRCFIEMNIRISGILLSTEVLLYRVFGKK